MKIIDLGPLELTSGQQNSIKDFIKKIIDFRCLKLVGPDASFSLKIRLRKSLIWDLWSVSTQHFDFLIGFIKGMTDLGLLEFFGPILQFPYWLYQEIR